MRSWLENECLNIGERSQIKEQDLNRQLCKKLKLGEDLDLGCREYNCRKPKSYKRTFRRNLELITKSNIFKQDIENLENFG